MSVADALLAIGRSDYAAAMSSARAATEHGSSVGAALVEFLVGVDSDGVYAEASAFEAFIGGGGNTRLYQRSIEAVSAEHRRIQPRSVLDIGCGDGRITAAVVGNDVERLELVEPSAALLAGALERLELTSTTVESHPLTIGEFLKDAPSASAWDLIQATFSLHALVPIERREVLEELCRRAGHLVIVEFDLPPFGDRSPEHAEYVAETYERGVAEYGDATSVVSGFLMPVMVGQFDPNRARLTHEQSADAWVSDLVATGWQRVAVAPVDDYWWAPAVRVTARGRARVD